MGSECLYADMPNQQAASTKSKDAVAALNAQSGTIVSKLDQQSDVSLSDEDKQMYRRSLKSDDEEELQNAHRRAQQQGMGQKFKQAVEESINEVGDKKAEWAQVALSLAIIA
jgi:hypothetical protein